MTSSKLIKHVYKDHKRQCKQCWNNLQPSNAATNFKNPALSVKIAVQKGILSKGQRILEVGSGNLRNALFVLENVPQIKVYAYDLNETVQRFIDRYSIFEEKGGYIVEFDNVKRKYDAIVCTFVLETICPEKNRRMILKKILKSLVKGGVLISSFRGYSGVRGTKYKICPMSEGFLTPVHTFIKPYSIPEVDLMLKSCGFGFSYPLQQYRVEKPENIHIIALREVKNGKKLVREILY